MEYLILFLIIAFVALCKGDSSLMEGIIKFVLIGGVILGIMFIGAYVPWLLIIAVVGIILYFVFQNNSDTPSHHSQSTNNKDDYNFHIDLPEPKTTVTTNNQIQNINSTPSDFQKELAQNTKTPQQVENDKWVTEMLNIERCAKKDYERIKDQLLRKAKSGEYTTTNENKYITIDYECEYIEKCIKRVASTNPTGKRGTNSYKENAKVQYTLDKTKEYELYLTTIKEIANPDNVNVSSYFTEILDTALKKYEIKTTLPLTYTHDFWVHNHKVKAYLKCSIQY
ncbi:MAG: hypothetical protein NC489_21085 [Ruminococcus flavefaciens]|nr:hypothetical protein [Ruminococcus flavefaciens]